MQFVKIFLKQEADIKIYRTDFISIIFMLRGITKDKEDGLTKKYHLPNFMVIPIQCSDLLDALFIF